MSVARDILNMMSESSGGGSSASSFTTNGKFLYPEEVVVPKTVTQLQADYSSFRAHTEIKKITFESGSALTGLPNDAFNGCTGLINITLPPSIRSMGNSVFVACSSLLEIELPAVTSIGNWTCSGCSSLKKVTLPSTITYMNNGNSFNGCTAVEEIILGQNWDYAANFSFTTLLSEQVLVNMLTALKDLSGTSAKTLTIGSDNIAKLTEEEKSIATNKNWVLA